MFFIVSPKSWRGNFCFSNFWGLTKKCMGASSTSRAYIAEATAIEVSRKRKKKREKGLEKKKKKISFWDRF